MHFWTIVKNRRYTICEIFSGFIFTKRPIFFGCLHVTSFFAAIVSNMFWIFELGRMGNLKWATCFDFGKRRSLNVFTVFTILPIPQWKGEQSIFSSDRVLYRKAMELFGRRRCITGSAHQSHMYGTIPCNMCCIIFESLT